MARTEDLVQIGFTDKQAALLGDRFNGIYSVGKSETQTVVETGLFALAHASAANTIVVSAPVTLTENTILDADGLPIWWQGSKWIKADGSDA